MGSLASTGCGSKMFKQSFHRDGVVTNGYDLILVFSKGFSWPTCRKAPEGRTLAVRPSSLRLREEDEVEKLRKRKADGMPRSVWVGFLRFSRAGYGFSRGFLEFSSLEDSLGFLCCFLDSMGSPGFLIFFMSTCFYYLLSYYMVLNPGLYGCSRIVSSETITSRMQ